MAICCMRASGSGNWRYPGNRPSGSTSCICPILVTTGTAALNNNSLKNEENQYERHFSISNTTAAAINMNNKENQYHGYPAISPFQNSSNDPRGDGENGRSGGQKMRAPAAGDLRQPAHAFFGFCTLTVLKRVVSFSVAFWRLCPPQIPLKRFSKTPLKFELVPGAGRKGIQTGKLL
eukprot:3383683-Rhodomonas_salina.1